MWDKRTQKMQNSPIVNVLKDPETGRMFRLITNYDFCKKSVQKFDSAFVAYFGCGKEHLLVALKTKKTLHNYNQKSNGTPKFANNGRNFAISSHVCRSTLHSFAKC